MTFEEFSKVFHGIGNGDHLVDNETLTYILNGALRELYARMPITKTVNFNLRGHKPCTYYKEIICKSDQSITIPIQGMAYSFRVMGKGNYIVKDSVTTDAYQFDTGKESQLVRGFMNDAGTIRFWGGFTFVIYDLSIYDEIYSPEVESIPDGSPITVLNIREMYGDFLAFTSPPTDRFGKEIEGCRLYDGRFEISSDYSGEVYLTYRRLPKLITYVEDNDDVTLAENIDVSEEYLQPLLYLTWYHLWYNMDDMRSKIYKERFESLAKDILDGKRTVDTEYINENGWA